MERSWLNNRRQFSKEDGSLQWRCRLVVPILAGRSKELTYTFLREGFEGLSFRSWRTNHRATINRSLRRAIVREPGRLQGDQGRPG